MCRLLRAAGFDALIGIIDVPYISQWDSTAKLARGDCGIVDAAMIGWWMGEEYTPDELLERADLPVGKLVYTFDQVRRAAAAGGVLLRTVADADLSTILSELAAGRPTITLVRYAEFSGNQDDFGGAHFVVVVGIQDDRVIVNDPDFWSERRHEGYRRRVPITEFAAAIGDALKPTGNNPFQSLFFA